MATQQSHRIDLDESAACKHCEKLTYTEYFCHPKYDNTHTNYHRYCPKCRSLKQTDDGGYINCPTCITMYEEKLVVRQARSKALWQEEQKQADENARVGVILFIIITCLAALTWVLKYTGNM